jgi:hypothetical protein
MTTPGGNDDQLIGRLLGPADAEVTCETCFELLDAYVELELGGGGVAAADAGVPGMRAHLQGCPACDEDHRSLLALVGGRDDDASAS